MVSKLGVRSSGLKVFPHELTKLNKIDNEFYASPKSGELISSGKVSSNQPIASSTSIYSKVQAIFGKAAPLALQIIQKESSFNPKATNLNDNGSIDRGIFQINSIHKNKVKNLNDLFDVDTNIRIAKQIYDESGQSWRQWSTCRLIKDCY